MANAAANPTIPKVTARKAIKLLLKTCITLGVVHASKAKTPYKKPLGLSKLSCSHWLTAPTKTKGKMTTKVRRSARVKVRWCRAATRAPNQFCILVPFFLIFPYCRVLTTDLQALFQNKTTPFPREKGWFRLTN